MRLEALGPFIQALGLASVLTTFGAQAATCTGACGTLSADGVVSASPLGGNYNWVSTFGGVLGSGQLGNLGGFNGSSLVSDAFHAEAGATIEFWFNYVTSDGLEFADFGWAELRGAGTQTTLFTARTRPVGAVVPGFDLPGVGARLEPEVVTITSTNTNWTPLGIDSGQCFGDGCGSTGWVKSSYTVAAAGTYSLAFGVTNWSDGALDSGLAFQGAVINGSVIGNGSSPEAPLLPSEISDNGAFVFEFVPTPQVPVFIDPDFAIGYDYSLTAPGNSITSVVFPVLAGDADGYEIYELGNVSASGLLGTVLGGQTFVFVDGVTGFSLRGIDPAAMLDPSNPTAFVTGLTFATAAPVSISQMAVVPEPGTWALMAGGLLGLQVCARSKRRRCVTP